MTNRKAQWKGFMSTKRIGGDHDKTYDHGRTPFERDMDAIKFAESFRNLEGKTQVFSLARNDYVRNRLTHSIEVATVGKNIARNVGRRLIEKHDLDFSPYDFMAVVEAACLAHDIGHPPLAHAGEEAFREFFVNRKESLGMLVGERYSDFTNFEGNAHNIRILCDIEQSSRAGGLRLTSAVLGAITKYPRLSYSKDKDIEFKAKKFNFFDCDSYVLEEIAENLGLKKRSNGQEYIRSPLAYLVEAADDTCYAIVDIEDAFKMGVISYEKAVELLTPISGGVIERGEMDEIDHIQRMRAKAIGRISIEVADIFMENEDDILDGNFQGDILDYLSFADDFKYLKEFAGKFIYVSPVALEVRTAGYNIIDSLLSILIDASLDYLSNGTKASSKSLSYLAYIDEKKRQKILEADDVYGNLMGITDYVASMSDNKAVSVYKNFLGASIPTR